MSVFASKLYSQVVGDVAIGVEAGSIKYFISAIAMLFSIVEPPTPPTARGARPPTVPFVGEDGASGITTAGHILSTCRLPGPIEFGQPVRGSNRAIACPE